MDCGFYKEGGWCRQKGKTVCALGEACTERSDKASKPKVMEPDTEKVCHKCGKVLPIESFAINNRSSDGRQSYCRECSAKAYEAWRRKHPKKKYKKRKQNEDDE